MMASARLGTPSRRGAVGAHWAGLVTDHVAPGLVYTLACIGNVMLVAEIMAGAGPATGLDSGARAWLLAQRALFTAFVGLIALLFMFRRRRMGDQIGLVAALAALTAHPHDIRLRREVSQRIVPAIVAVAGTNAIALQGFFPVTETSLLFTVPGAVLGVVGLLLSAISLACLGRCFGVFPEVRGLVTRGPYAFVRHPLYLSEIIASLGGLLTALSPLALGVFLVFVALQYRRATYEERVLGAMFPEYAAYSRRTWRILPGIH
jgi:protein-S-isoprenylcysteine O-methyltransferase Ste14